MLTSTRKELRRLTLKWANEIKSCALSWETGIYPGEMAGFLALCELGQVASIIESGRGLHAYSTRVLGEYSDRMGVNVVSIDFENDAVRGAEYRRQLARYSRVRCLTGDALQVFPDAAALSPGPIGLLLDGPKGHVANGLSLVASLLYPVTVLGTHNSEPTMPWTDQFGRLFPGAYHYESLDEDGSDEWKAFKAWEREAVDGYELPGMPGRSLSVSSLVLAALPGGARPASRLEGLQGFKERRAARRMMRRWERRTAELARGRT